MSLSETSPLIKDWIKLGLEWHYTFQPEITPFVVPALGNIQIPVANPVNFEASEGTLKNYGGVFDNTLCGIRLECYPGLDSHNLFTVGNLLAGGAFGQPFPSAYAMAPPLTPPGIFIVDFPNEWPWKGWLRLHVFNADVVPHVCLALAYTICLLDETRPKETEISLLEKISNLLGKLPVSPAIP